MEAGTQLADWWPKCRAVTVDSVLCSRGIHTLGLRGNETTTTGLVALS